jgi:hypothetical protein
MNVEDCEYELEQETFDYITDVVYDSSSHWVYDQADENGLKFSFKLDLYIKNIQNIKEYSAKLIADVDSFYKELSKCEKEGTDNTKVFEKWIDKSFSQLKGDDELYDRMIDKYTGMIYHGFFTAMKNDINIVEDILIEAINKSARRIMQRVLEDKI